MCYSRLYLVPFYFENQIDKLRQTLLNGAQLKIEIFSNTKMILSHRINKDNELLQRQQIQYLAMKFTSRNYGRPTHIQLQFNPSSQNPSSQKWTIDFLVLFSEYYGRQLFPGWFSKK